MGDYVEIIDRRKLIIQASQNNLKIDYFLSIIRFYYKFSYSSLFYSASSCHSHFRATYQLFAPGSLGSIPFGVMCIFFQIFDNFPTKIVIFFCKNCHFFCKNYQIFLQKSSNLSSANRQIFLQKSSRFPEKIIKFSCQNFLTILHKLLDFPLKIGRLTCENRQIFLKDRQIFLQKSLHFSAKIVKFFCKNYQNFL